MIYEHPSPPSQQSSNLTRMKLHTIYHEHRTRLGSNSQILENGQEILSIPDFAGFLKGIHGHGLRMSLHPLSEGVDLHLCTNTVKSLQLVSSHSIKSSPVPSEPCRQVLSQGTRQEFVLHKEQESPIIIGCSIYCVSSGHAHSRDLDLVSLN